MSTNALNSQGVIIAISSSVSPDSFTTIPEVKSINGPSGSGSIIDTTDLSSTAREKVMGLMDEGQVSLDLNYIPNNAVHELLRNQRATKALCLFRITFTDSSSTKYTFSGYVTGFAVSAGVDASLAASVTIEITGAVTKS